MGNKLDEKENDPLRYSLSTLNMFLERENTEPTDDDSYVIE